MALTELITPITVDLRALDLRMDIQKGLEKMLTHDAPWDPGMSVAVDLGDWVMRTATGYAPPSTGTAVPNVFPVIAGNQEYDGQATGGVTVAIGGGLIYSTNKFYGSIGSYAINMNLCAKGYGGNELTLSPVSGGDAIVARVLTVDSVKGVLTILTLNR